jgi:hypothetical protein
MSRSIDPQQSLVVAGVARGDITPPVGIYHRMWGAATHDISTGIHRPLTATVLTVAPFDAEEDASAAGQGARIAVAIDHCLLWTTEMRTLIERVSSRSGIDPESFVIFFSHTHGAGLMGLERQELPGGEMIPQYLDDLADTIGQLVGEAQASSRPASITYGIGRCSLAANRDFWDAEHEQYVCGYNPDGSADDGLVVGRVSDTDGKTLMTLVNYACHPTTLAWDNTLISPDYVGAMREVVERGTHAPCLFIQGASGDVGPREGFVGDVAVADRNGRQLGYAALSALEDLPPPASQFVYAGPVVSGATIGTWRYEPLSDAASQAGRVWRSTECRIELPMRADLPRRDALLAERDRWRAEEESATAAGDSDRAREARAMAERATRRLVRVAQLPEAQSYPYRATLWRTGDAIWIALNGEHYNVLQTELRRRFPGYTLVIGTLANGSDVWYLPDADSYGKGLYQEDASILARGSLETLIDALTISIRRLIDENA